MTWFFVLNVGAVIVIAFALLYYFVNQRNFFQERSEMLLLNILPKEISEALRAGHQPVPAQYEAASILFRYRRIHPYGGNYDAVALGRSSQRSLSVFR